MNQEEFMDLLRNFCGTSGLKFIGGGATEKYVYAIYRDTNSLIESEFIVGQPITEMRDQRAIRYTMYYIHKETMRIRSWSFDYSDLYAERFSFDNWYSYIGMVALILSGLVDRHNLTEMVLAGGEDQLLEFDRLSMLLGPLILTGQIRFIIQNEMVHPADGLTLDLEDL